MTAMRGNSYYIIPTQTTNIPSTPNSKYNQYVTKRGVATLERTGSSPHVLQHGGFPQQLRHIVGGPGLLIGTGKALLDLIDFVFISVVACLFVPSQLGKPQQLQHGGLPQHIKQALGGLDGLEYT
ncbi:unnamed protein product [Adineta steineri]|uniref:Uncharacterized protein n=1 Tax=Adineta steineri TaxID=433720 RepID=A0A815IVS1_9BILA|nr:unnamed protein product [Adineta steineri]CAF1604020.1 unnamed protein product [Adineta steineri]